MATLTAWAFPAVDGADLAVEKVSRLQTQDLIRLQDAAIVTWPTGKSKPKTRQLNNLAGAGAVGGAFWGMLFGLLFFIPLIGAAVGAAMGALTASMADVGIDDNFIRSVKQRVTPGTSALFLLTSDAVMDRVQDAFTGLNPELMASNLSTEQESKLREVFTED